MNLTPYFKSIIDQDTASVVICNLAHEIIYIGKSNRPGQCGYRKDAYYGCKNSYRN